MPLTAFDINNMDENERVALLSRLIPPVLFKNFSVDRDTFIGPGGGQCVIFKTPSKMPFFQIEFWRDRKDQDPILFLDISTTSFGQMEISFIVVNDPLSERFNIDRDRQGNDTYFGSVRRNLEEEERAMNAGLAPGQVRKGLRLMQHLISVWEDFFQFLGHRYYFLEPLGYYSAIIYERYGFNYISGKERMCYIDREFRKGGVFYSRLDGSSPFREKGMEGTVRGRAWAIHDGIMGDPWVSPKMYKTIGLDANQCTFPGYVF